MVFKNLIDDNKGMIIISENIIDIKNYQDIISFDDNNFKVKVDNKIINFSGKNITVKLLKQEELILSGSINNIEYRWCYAKYFYK